MISRGMPCAGKLPRAHAGEDKDIGRAEPSMPGPGQPNNRDQVVPDRALEHDFQPSKPRTPLGLDDELKVWLDSPERMSEDTSGASSYTEKACGAGGQGGK